MDSLKVVTLRRHSYGGKVRQQGDVYYMDHPKHVKVFTAIKKIMPAPATPAPVREKVKQVTPQAPPQTIKPSSTYRRKDVTKAPENKKKNENTAAKD